VRPGLPSLDLPTGDPHLAQNRLSSDTSGLAMITERGSGTGAAGTDVMPAPRRCVLVRVEPRRRVGRVPCARAEPIGALDSREELLVRVLPERDAGTLAASDGALAGEPQTLQ